MQFSEVVHEAIRLSGIVASEYEDRSRTSLPGMKFHPAKYRQQTEAEEDLRDFFIGLPIATIYTLIVIMYAGRGDFAIKDFLDLYEQMSDIFQTPLRAIDQMTDKVALPEYLQEGLKSLAEADLDVNTLMDRSE